MARVTWLGATLPDAQADPVAMDTPARSKAITAVSPAHVGHKSALVFGNRGRDPERITTVGQIERIEPSRKPLSVEILSMS